MYLYKNACLHEASHAVVDYLLGIETDRVVVYTFADEKSDFLGQCHRPTGNKILNRQNQVISLFAGMIGELLDPIIASNESMAKLLQFDSNTIFNLGGEGDREGIFSIGNLAFKEALRLSGKHLPKQSEVQHDYEILRKLQKQNAEKDKVSKEWLIKLALITETLVNSNSSAIEAVALEFNKESWVEAPAGTHVYEKHKNKNLVIKTVLGTKVKNILESHHIVFGASEQVGKGLDLPDVSSIEMI